MNLLSHTPQTGQASHFEFGLITVKWVEFEAINAHEYHQAPIVWSLFWGNPWINIA